VIQKDYEAKIKVNPADRPASIEQNIFGHFVEFMFDCIDGGMWAQLLKNRGFECPDENGDHVSDPWYPIGKTDGFLYEMDDKECLGTGHSQKITVINHYGGYRGIAQKELVLHQGERYSGSLWLKGDREIAAQVTVLNQKKEVLFQQDFAANESWGKKEFAFTAEETVLDATFEVRLFSDGTLWVDQTSLMPGSAENGIWKNAMKYIRGLTPPLIRFPGGCFADCYHWEDGIGERDLRPARPNAHWGGMEDNSFGTDEFMQFCRAVGCEPMICINFGLGTPQEAANWVEYCNGSADTKYGALRCKNGHPEPYRVKYWDIGNETFGDWEIGHCDAGQYAQRYLQFHEAMYQKDNGILFLGCAGDGNDFSQEWNRTILEKLGSKMNVLCLHTYTPHLRQEVHDNEKIYYSVVGSSQKYARVVADSLESIRQAGDSEIKLGITEWNTSYANEALREHTLEAAIFNATMLNLFIRNAKDITVCNFSDLVNGWPGGCIRSKNDEVYGTASYYVLKLYTTARPRFVVASQTETPAYRMEEKIGHVDPLCDVPYLDAVSTLDGNGDLLIFAVNRHFTDAVQLNIDCKQPWNHMIEHTEIFSENPYDINEWNNEHIIPVAREIMAQENIVLLQAHSVNLIRIKLN
jgi:alpha-L-arabinofuranosidase